MAAEKNFENKVKAELTRRGAWFVKFFANAYTKKGIPDILCCYKGFFIGIEVKGGSNYGMTELQKYNLKKIREAGGIGICVYPSGYNDFIMVLDYIDSHNESIIDDNNYILK